ncbi:MAG: lipoyl domain-containing protein, partial [Treponema sp.]|nr:lipoyl domain-containing protein [Treponema sp.]
MAHVLIMPRQGNTVESCILVEWKVKEGDAVTDETEVCSVETDKAAFDVPAGADGVVLKLLRAAGDDVPVLEPIAVIGAAGGDWQAAIAEDSAHRGTEAQREIVMGKGQGEQQPPSPPPRAPAPPREASAGI